VSSLDDCWTRIFLSKSHLTDVIARNSAGFHIKFKDSKTHNNQTESEQSSSSTTTSTSTSTTTNDDDDETSSTIAVAAEEEDDKKMKMQKGNDANDASIDVDIDIDIEVNDDDDDTGEVTAEQVVLEEMISEPRWNPVVLRMTTLPFEAIHTAADNDSTEIFCSENRPIDKLCAADDDESKKEEAPSANDDSVRGGATKKNEWSKNKQKVFCPRQQRVDRSSLQVKDLETDWWEYENDHLFEKDDESYERVNKDNKKEEKERQVEKEKQEVTCFGMKGSAPLCLGTIEDQFELIEDSYTADAFKQVVHKSLGVPLEQMTDLVDYPYTLKDRCLEERHKTIVYFATMAPAEKIERLIEKKVNKQDDALMERVRERVLQRQQASLKTKKQQEQTTATTTTSSSVATSMIQLDENDDADKDQWKLGINAGIQMLTRRAGIKSMDPDAICMAEDLLRDFLKRVISRASERLGEGELPYTSTKYSGLWPYNFDPSRKLKSHEERDEDDAELKVQPEDIYLAVEHEIGKKLYGYAPLRIFEPFSTSNRKIKLLPELEEKEESDTLQTAQDIITSITNEQLWGFDVIEEQDSVRDISLDDDDEEEMDDFIDDSEAASYWSADGFDPSKLGDSLQDKLLLASIRAHEEVYGVERAHKEKLYLTNWFGCGPSFFNLTSFNPKSFYHDDVSYVGKTEEEIIAYDKWEDIEYYGNSELLPEEEEEEGEVDGADYHLRRLIRQETLAVLNDFLGHKIEKKIVPSESTAAPQEDASDTESDMLDIELWDESESDEEDTENIRRNSTRAQQAESSVGVSASEEAALTTTNQLPELASNAEVKNETNEEIK